MKKNILNFILIIFVFFSQSGFAQMKTADKLYERFAYSKAIPYYQKVISSKKNEEKKITAISRLADCYRYINNYEKACYWYQKAVANQNTEAINYFYLGTVLRSMARYAEAQNAFLTYSKLNPSDIRGQKYAEFCKEIQNWKNYSAVAIVKNKVDINSATSDFSPVIHNGRIVFASDRGLDMLDNNNYNWTGNAYLDLYYSTPGKNNDFKGKLNLPEKMPGNINQPYHDGPASFTKLNKMVFITRTIRSSAKSEKEETDLLAIYYADSNEQNPNFVSFPYNSDQYSVGHPAISPNGLKLIFSSDMPEGKGGSDLYLSLFKNGKWTNPVNLGNVINTFGDEVFPYWENDSTLYFSSDSHMGYGGLDIFKTTCISGEWTTPVNLRSPINSSYDDFGITFLANSSDGFFSSNRPGGKGSDDIYQFTGFHKNKEFDLNNPIYVSGFVKENKSGSPIEDAMVFLYDTSSDEALMVKTNKDGFYKLPAEPGKNYVVKAVKELYFDNCLSFIAQELENQNSGKAEPGDLFLTKIEIDKVFKVENIYYDLDSWEIRDNARVELKKLVNLLDQYPISVEIRSHTDCRGSEEYNANLSEKRAETVRRFLIANEIYADRITANGYGESIPLNSCIDGTVCSEEEYQANRRTEFKITGINSSFMKQKNFLPDFKSGDKIPLKVLGKDFFKTCNENIVNP